MKKNKLLKMRIHNASKERAFERAFQKSLNFNQRFSMMLNHSRYMLEMLIRNGHRKPTEIIKRS